jgi:hypothetical protein
LQSAKQHLNRLADRVNVRIAINNDLFISLLYPASSCKELVANMASRIGHKELREEAEMHLGVIGRLVEKLNKLVDKLNIEKLASNKEEVSAKTIKKEIDPATIIKIMVENLDGDRLKDFTGVMKSLLEKSNPHGESSQDKVIVNDFGIYILTDEAQAVLGMMTEIEERRLLVEKLVRSDRGRQSITVGLVTIYIGTIICLTISAYFQFGSDSRFIVGNDLTKSKLAFVGIPWPVALWSLIGSFAAMIYRFNRQPIYDFTDAVKWMLTRPVQGLVLGSAFYLVLGSGLFLLTGGSSAAATSTSVSRVTTEIILVLAFLVGFSDRFADSVFNTLVDKYSSKNPEGSKKENKQHEDAETTKG